MDFTIEVKGRGKEEEFKFGDLELFHKECIGGHIVHEYVKANNHWKLTCMRCDVCCHIAVSNDGTTAIVKTAIDGEKKAVKSLWDKQQLCVVRRV